ncbi:hypothetical protein LSH36_184g07034 [Paralvinella palmiformis]|uniref:Uncharacterized protein n=1 Tax=Paralvinella palmiformis TaxID=53620 RepID=A0AAD9N7F8_9ANNE|nr:hypothetical protein LSH36_184g07034 [Paralvinella palmiformis]
MADISNPIRMRKDINLLSACSIMTGVIIGSGIFISPVSFISNCGSVAMSLVMWIFSGVLSLCVALCFVELAGLFPKSGGEYIFFKEILGPLPAFVNVWHHFIMIQPSMQALLAITTTDYLVQSIFGDYCDFSSLACRLFTIWIISKRVVPQATIISMLMVTVLYTLTNVAYFTVMSPEDMTSSKAVALTVISILYVVTGEAIALLEYLGFLATLMLVVSVYCVLYLKWKKPNINRPIKAPYTNGMTMLLLATGIPVYYIMVVWASKQTIWITKMGKYTTYTD